MVEKRDRTHLRFGSRLALLRKEKGLTQGDFCAEFSQFCGYKKAILIPSVSSWEQNHRLPAMETIVQLALFFGVSTDYLFGITEDRNGSNGNEKRLKTSAERACLSDCPIKRADYPRYNHQPVYVRFKSHSHLDQWGILMYEDKKIVCGSFTVSLALDVDCYSMAPLSPVRTQITSLQQLIDTQNVWVEMKCKDPEVSALYTGRYTHHPDNTARCLIKSDNGLPLPYSGLDVYYWAFRG